MRIMKIQCVCVCVYHPREPTYDYKEDSVFSIEPPEVSPRDEIIYERSVAVMTMGPLPPPQASIDMYNQYAKMACR